LGFDQNHRYLSNGFVMLPNDFLKTNLLTTCEKIVFICLLSFAYKGDTCFPSLVTLRDMTGLSKPTLIKCIKILGDKDFLKVEKILGGNNTYILNLTNLNNIIS